MAEKEKPQRSIIVVIFGGFFTLIGGAVLVLTTLEYVATVGTYGWEKVPAEIASIDIDYPKQAPNEHDDNVFELTTKYEYEVAGKEYQGTAVRLKPFTSDDYHRLADRKYGMIRDEVQSAFVDPNDPDKAILERNSLASGWIVLFPIPFLLIGLGMMAAGLGWFSGDRAKEGKFTKSFASEAKNSPIGGCGMALFGSVFFAFGLGFLFPLLITPLMRRNSASEWKETPCTVIWSRVSVHTGEDSDTYAPDVFYAYEYNGETHRSNQYSFVTVSSSGRKAKREIVRKYPAGHKTTCFVDPVQPWHAVINRDKGQVGFWWLLPSLFLVVGGVIVTAGLTAFRKPGHARRRF